MALQGLQVPQRTTATDQAYNVVLAAILDGTIPPGSALPLQELALSLGMSMMPVREAIRQLEATGIIEIEPHRGARVRPISEDDLEDTYMARIELEGTLVELAARRFGAKDTEEAQRALDDQQLAIQRGDFVAARLSHELFHHSIYRAAGSDWLFRSIGPTWHNSERYRSPGMNDPAIVDARRLEHQLILNACTDHDPVRARAALRSHLMSTVRGLNPAVAKRLDEHFPPRS